MPRAGLTKEKIICAAVELIEARGTAEFSMRSLAATLGVKTASLYNHVAGMNELLVGVCLHALQMQRDEERRAVADMRGAQAIMALAEAYRRFAKQHWELYRLIMNSAVSYSEQVSEISQCITEPFMAVLSDSALTQEEMAHWQRVLRAMVHGFVSQEAAGFFAHFPADADESFRVGVQCYIDGLAAHEGRVGK